MELPVNRELVAQLQAFACGHQDLAALRAWLAEHVWELADSPSPLDRMLAGETELALAECDRGHRQPHEVREQVTALLGALHPRYLAAPQ